MATTIMFSGTSLNPEYKLGLKRWESFSVGAIPSPNIPDPAKTREDSSFSDSQIGAFEPSFYGTIIHAALTLLAYVI